MCKYMTLIMDIIKQIDIYLQINYNTMSTVKEWHLSMTTF